jgi:hypothetical protein
VLSRLRRLPFLIFKFNCLRDALLSVSPFAVLRRNAWSLISRLLVAYITSLLIAQTVHSHVKG